jgi:GntR family transcriptional repressor for pyruvate dehydrogenase complex
MTTTEAVAQQLIGLVNSGALKRGDRLPPERDLAKRLNVGRTSVREALKLLTLSGLLEARRGDGTYVRHVYSSFVAKQMEWPVLLSAQDVEHVFEVREALELRAASLAAQRATPEEVERIAIFREQRSDHEDVEKETDTDLAFHHNIVLATHNPLLERLMLSVQNLLREYVKLSISRTPVDQGSTMVEHEAVYKAIAAHDPTAAMTAMSRHLQISRLQIEQSAALYGNNGPDRDNT